jgi:hypothetical protein
MEFRGDERAQAVQIGAILLFAAVIISLSGYQAFVVPQENGKIEFGDFQTAAGDMADLQNALLGAAGGTARGESVRTGSTYPTRTFSVNPPPASGTLRTTGDAEIALTNAVAVDGEAENTRTFWNGRHHNFSTKSVVFEPAYNEFDAPPVVASGVAAYRAFSGSISAETGQVLVQGNRITVVSVVGNVSTGGLTSSVVVEPVSAATRTVTVTGDGGGSQDINVSLPVAETTTASAWASSEVARSLRANENVLDVDPVEDQRVNVSLDGSQTYRLQLARVEVRQAGSSGGTADPGPRYVVPVTGDQSSMSAEQTLGVSTEVRDRFNNPVSGTNVSYSLFSDSTSDANQTIYDVYGFPGEEGPAKEVGVVTDGEGRAATVFDPFRSSPPANFSNGLAYVNATVEKGPQTLETSNMTVNVFRVAGGAGAGSGGGGGGGGGEAGSGDESEWTTGDKETTVTSSNGKWTSIDKIESINLYEGETIGIQSCNPGGGSCSGDDVLEVNFKVTNPTSTYYVKMILQDGNRDGDFADTGGGQGQGNTQNDERFVSVSGDASFSGQLTTTATNNILSGTGTDILDDSAYEANEVSQTQLNALKLTNADVIFGRVDGRVKMKIDDT